jgi:hypothetical protein
MVSRLVTFERRYASCRRTFYIKPVTCKNVKCEEA